MAIGAGTEVPLWIDRPLAQEADRATTCNRFGTCRAQRARLLSGKTTGKGRDFSGILFFVFQLVGHQDEQVFLRGITERQTANFELDRWVLGKMTDAI